MTKEYQTIVNTIVLPYRWALGPTWTRFFDGLQEEKIYGTRCRTCQKVFVPARSFCPDCLADLDEWTDVAQEGTIKSWTLVEKSHFGQVRQPPYALALIRLDGADCEFIHFLGGIDMSDPGKVRKKLKAGIRVKAVWNKEKHADIHDLSYFEPLK
jgi:uncharacterized OB-fold protein